MVQYAKRHARRDYQRKSVAPIAEELRGSTGRKRRGKFFRCHPLQRKPFLLLSTSALSKKKCRLIPKWFSEITRCQMQMSIKISEGKNLPRRLREASGDQTKKKAVVISGRESLVKR